MLLRSLYKSLFNFPVNSQPATDFLKFTACEKYEENIALLALRCMDVLGRSPNLTKCSGGQPATEQG